jgi:hypothetical protein
MSSPTRLLLSTGSSSRLSNLAATDEESDDEKTPRASTSQPNATTGSASQRCLAVPELAGLVFTHMRAGDRRQDIKNLGNTCRFLRELAMAEYWHSATSTGELLVALRLDARQRDEVRDSYRESSLSSSDVVGHRLSRAQLRNMAGNPSSTEHLTSSSSL